MSTTTLDAASLKGVKLEQLKEAAESLELPVYGNKLDVASRLQANKKGGKSMLKKLITSAHKDKPTKTIEKKAKAPAALTKAAFIKKERARLIAAGATDKAKVDAECKRLWDLKHNKTSGDKIITETKLLDEATRKARGLVLCGADSSGGKTVFKYKPSGKTKAAPVQPKKKGKAKKEEEEEEESDDESDSDDEDMQDAVLKRLATKKIEKREWLDGMNSVYGVDTKGWSLKHAREELVTQMFNQTDNEDSDDDEDSDEDSDDE